MRNLTLVVMLLGIMGIIDIIGITVLAVGQHPIPDPLTVVLASIVTGMIGLLVKPGPESPPPAS